MRIKRRPGRPPVLSTLSPTSGRVGDTVTLTGSRFGTTGTVWFGEIDTEAASWSASRITALVPAGAVTALVEVQNAAGISNGVPFTVVADPPPPPPPPPPGTITTGDALRAALAGAQPGDVLVLGAGAVLTGPFTLPVKSGDLPIILRSSAMAQLPPAGTRVQPSHAPLMPRLTSPGADQPAIATAPGAHHWRLEGLEVCPASAVTTDTLITLGDGGAAQNTLALVPHHLVLNRCYIHGLPTAELKRGVGLNCGDVEVSDCTVAECKGQGYDTQALCGWNGPGPFLIRNSDLEGAGENVMFGGADPSIPDLVPSDITFHGNYVHKPVAWRGVWSVKNLFELKNARRVTITGNVFENNWQDAQSGFGILFTSLNQDQTAPWTTVEDVTFEGNVVRHSGCGLNVTKNAINTQPPARIRIANNLITDINGPAWGGVGIFLQLGSTADCEVAHNTVLQSGNILTLFGDPCTGFIFRDNIAPHNNYGVIGDSVGVGTPALEHYCPGYRFDHNVIPALPPGVTPASYPTGNFYPAGMADVGFVDLAGGDYRLAATSSYHNASTEGTDVGADVAGLVQMAAAVIAGTGG